MSEISLNQRGISQQLAMARLTAVTIKRRSKRVLCFHSAFGLQVSSNLPIPGLPLIKQGDPVDVKVRLGSRPLWLEQSLHTAKLRSLGPEIDDHGNSTRKVWELRGGTHFHYCYADGTEFVLNRAGTEVWARWPDNSTIEDTATYLLGPIFGFLMRLRGFICLHASAVVIQGRAIAFLGPAGSGKSSLATSLADLGFPILSDDVSVLVDCSDHFLVQPAYPRLRLWSDSVSALFGHEDCLPLLTPNWDKRYLDLTDNIHKFHQEPSLLARIYFLGPRRSRVAPVIEEVAPNERIITLVSNSYANYMLDREMRSREFELLSRLIAKVPLRRITPHSEIQKLPELCELVVRDLNAPLTERDHSEREEFPTANLKEGTRPMFKQSASDPSEPLTHIRPS